MHLIFYQKEEKTHFRAREEGVAVTSSVTCWGCDIIIVIYEGLYFDLAQGQMNGAPNETRTHSCRFASLTC